MPGASTGTQAGAIRFEQIAANCPRTIQGTNPGSALTSVEDDKVWLHKLRKLVIGGADEHVAHEERVVRACAHDADFVAVLRRQGRAQEGAKKGSSTLSGKVST